MNYDNFKELLANEIKQQLLQKDIKATVRYHMNHKVNTSYEGLVIHHENIPEGTPIPVIPVKELYENYLEYKASISDIAKETIRNTEKHQQSVDYNKDIKVSSYDEVKDRLYISLIAQKGNEELLKTIPHKEVADMAIIYRIDATGSFNQENTQASIIVKNELFSVWNVKEEALHQDALENSPKIHPAKITSMKEMMMNLMPVSLEKDILEELQEEMITAAPVGAYILGNDAGVNGAAVCFYPGFLDECVEKMNGDFYLLPSSVHEMILHPDKDVDDPMYFKDMVTEINATQVAPEERLTDNAYHYDSKNKLFETIEEYLERTERDMEQEERD